MASTRAERILRLCILGREEQADPEWRSDRERELRAAWRRGWNEALEAAAKKMEQAQAAPETVETAARLWAGVVAFLRTLPMDWEPREWDDLPELVKRQVVAGMSALQEALSLLLSLSSPNGGR